MSLLMKALANAAKEKQAQQATELVSALALAPIDTLTAVTKDAVDNDKNPTQTKPSFEEESEFNAAFLSSETKATPNDKRFAPKVESPFGVNSEDAAPSAPLMPFELDTAHMASAASADQASAAKAFVTHPPAATSKPTLVLFGLTCLLLLALALQGYAYLRDQSGSASVQITPMAALPATTATRSEALVALPEISNVTKPAIEESSNNTATLFADSKSNIASKPSPVIKAQAGTGLSSLNPNVADQSASASVNAMDLTRPHGLVQLISKKPAASVDPVLLAAYQAFNRGEDGVAQQQYRQLLQHDVRNVDALLGMAAIAQRQGRDADAIGWYQALQEIEPRNVNAQMALLSLQANTDAVATGSRIKSLLVQQPEDASLHEALGNVYAAQNQWTDAQQAYFNASRFAPDNADYAFNLAISLDQLGKSKLALQQYQRSLDLINSSGGSSPERTQLEARIHKLQDQADLIK